MNLTLLITTVFLLLIFFWIKRKSILLICIIFSISVPIYLNITGNFETKLINNGKIISITKTGYRTPYKPDYLIKTNSGYIATISINRINNFKIGDNFYTEVYKDKNTFPIPPTIALCIILLILSIGKFIIFYNDYKW